MIIFATEKIIMSHNNYLDFSNTEIAFASKSNAELSKTLWLFKLMNSQKLVSFSIALSETALKLKLPIKWFIKKTIFEHFCGGENLKDVEPAIARLASFKIGTILDYSVEGQNNEHSFEMSTAEIIRTIQKAKTDNRIPFAVFKVTGIADFGLLEKINSGELLTSTEEEKLKKIHLRLKLIFDTALANDTSIFVDAEETWIQGVIDHLVEEYMPIYNTQKAIIYNTIQLYRNDRIQYLVTQIDKAEKENYFYGIKLVRGAYMEKERERAIEKGYATPINKTKEISDQFFDEALRICLKHIKTVAVCAGTHNEKSTLLLTTLMKEKGIENNDPHIYFSQLLGMSDNLSYNLSEAGYNVAKYVPYGPVYEVLPYLIRRAQENSSMAGQMSREFSLIKSETDRRKKL